MTSPRPFDLRRALTSLAQYEQAHPGFLQVLGAAGRKSDAMALGECARPQSRAFARPRERPPASPSLTAPHHTALERAQGAAAWLATGAVLYLVALVLLLYSEIRACLIVRSQVRVPAYVLYISCVLCVSECVCMCG
jgi:hypothetical protein